jgi:hypothetical protein
MHFSVELISEYCNFFVIMMMISTLGQKSIEYPKQLYLKAFLCICSGGWLALQIWVDKKCLRGKKERFFSTIIVAVLIMLLQTVAVIIILFVHNFINQFISILYAYTCISYFYASVCIYYDNDVNAIFIKVMVIIAITFADIIHYTYVFTHIIHVCV